MRPVYFVKYATGLYPSYFLSLWERIEVRVLVTWNPHPPLSHFVGEAIKS
jgi:hypothetical protein